MLDTGLVLGKNLWQVMNETHIPQTSKCPTCETEQKNPKRLNNFIAVVRTSYNTEKHQVQHQQLQMLIPQLDSYHGPPQHSISPIVHTSP